MSCLAVTQQFKCKQGSMHLTSAPLTTVPYAAALAPPSQLPKRYCMAPAYGTSSCNIRSCQASSCTIAPCRHALRCKQPRQRTVHPMMRAAGNTPTATSSKGQPIVMTQLVTPEPLITPTAVSTAASAPVITATAAAAASAAAVAYDATDTADTWSRRPVPVVARLLEIIAAFGGWWLRTTMHKDEHKAAADMREVLIKLGPAFVKIGQALSSRPDVLPPAYLTELELLQDRIPPFADEEALQVIEEELGMSWQAVFAELSASPIAAASLGQVYRGRLVGSGAEVAVKVQRPGVVEAIGRDTYILRHLAAIARRQLKLNTDLPALVDEWAASLFKELDYRREAANASRFAKLFAFMPDVVVPTMYPQCTTPRVLVMEWVQGERLRSAAQQSAAAIGNSGNNITNSLSDGTSYEHHQQQQRQGQGQRQLALDSQKVADDLRLVEIGVRCSLEQMLEEGFYHADPHPGNLLKTSDGRLAYLDFGMMGEIEPPVRQALIRATLHLVNREYERLAEDFVVLGLLPQGQDLDDVIPALTEVFQNALAAGVSNLSFSTLSADLGKTMYRYSFRIPPYYTLLVRSLSVLEGIALASDPNYKVLGAAYPWVSRRLLTQDSAELHETLHSLLYDSQGRFRFDRLESLLEQAAKAAVSNSSSSIAALAAQSSNSIAADQASSSRSILQQVFANSPVDLVGSLLPPLPNPLAAWITQQQQQQQQPEVVSGRGSRAAAAGGPIALVLSPEGYYIRGILEDELAKGLDAAWRLGLDYTLEQATQRIEGAVSVLPPGLLPPWLQQSRAGAAAAIAGPAAAAYNTSSGSSSLLDGQSLLDTFMHLPRLAVEEDKEQVQGLVRLANQLSAISTAKQQLQASAVPAGASNGSNSTSVAAHQLEQTSAALRWFVSEVQLLSLEARREALAIPFNILQKLASRLAARTVRAVLTPAAGFSTGAGTSVAAVAARQNSASSSAARRKALNSRNAAAKQLPGGTAAASSAAISYSSGAGSDSAVTSASIQQQAQVRGRVQGSQRQPRQPKQRILTYTPAALASSAPPQQQATAQQQLGRVKPIQKVAEAMQSVDHVASGPNGGSANGSSSFDGNSNGAGPVLHGTNGSSRGLYATWDQQQQKQKFKQQGRSQPATHASANGSVAGGAAVVGYSSSELRADPV